jgi:hypothetical protein
MTDRELLENAAKAAGFAIHANNQASRDACGAGDVGLWISRESTCWNPLTDDGDALRLAVKLNLLTTECVEDWKWCRDKKEHADVCASYRRAIVRAAAEIGRNMT